MLGRFLARCHVLKDLITADKTAEMAITCPCKLGLAMAITDHARRNAPTNPRNPARRQFHGQVTKELVNFVVTVALAWPDRSVVRWWLCAGSRQYLREFALSTHWRRLVVGPARSFIFCNRPRSILERYEFAILVRIMFGRCVCFIFPHEPQAKLRDTGSSCNDAACICKAFQFAAVKE